MTPDFHAHFTFKSQSLTVINVSISHRFISSAHLPWFFHPTASSPRSPDQTYTKHWNGHCCPRSRQRLHCVGTMLVITMALCSFSIFTMEQIRALFVKTYMTTQGPDQMHRFRKTFQPPTSFSACSLKSIAPNAKAQCVSS